MPDKEDPDATNPGFRIPSAEGVVAVAGTEPLPLLLDLNRDGVADSQQSWFWHSIVSGAYSVLGFIAPKAIETQIVRAARPKIDAVIDEVTK